MSWRSSFNSAFEDEDDGYGRPHSLEQSLIDVAARWESERKKTERVAAQELSEQRRKTQEGASLLRTERARSAELENSLREETAKLQSERERAADLQQELTKSRAQCLGSHLLLASLRKQFDALAKLVPKEGDLLPSPLKLTHHADAAADAAGERGLESTPLPPPVPDTSEVGSAAALAEMSQTDEAAQQASIVKSESGTSEGGGAIGSAISRCASLLADLPTSLPSADEFVGACRDGKARLVESGLSPSGMTELLLSRAETVLCDGLEASVAGGHVKIAKVLLEGGADAQRTSALHLAIRHGHTSLMAHLVAATAISVNARDAAGASPLHIAAECNQLKAAQYLLKHSAFADALSIERR